MTRLQWVMRFCLLGLVLLAAIVVLGSCAAPEQRWLTKEEDADLKAKCEHQNCVVIPAGVLQQLMERLRGMSI